ncbi:MAG: 4-oxalocrotonate tautomerase [Symploca sp. SIO1C4]|uniref:4-oxalocrotonate tautomerase n=1 Tax=Symploca sp. SIO1C4 TaxID=2607765 RepID=A0A6B3N824_9CYAN|nr:4-oxalocrotonate tautomerase [Symploca sp. SIO1C4]
MPLFTVYTWPEISQEIKSKWIYQSTKITVELLNTPPDKIQVLIQEIAQENWGKAGVVPTASDFPHKSRVTNWSTQHSYHNQQSVVSNMVIITVDAWNVSNQEQKNVWAKKLTDITVSLLNTSPDNVLILFRDMPPSHWSQAGVTGNHSDFLMMSRQL